MQVNINDLINKEEKHIKLITKNDHRFYIEKILNSLAEENGEWHMTLISLSRFASQLWAKEVRENIKTDYKSLMKMIDDNYGNYFGIDEMNKLNYQAQCLKYSDQIINLLDSEIDILKPLYREPLEAVHKLNKQNMNKYELSKKEGEHGIYEASVRMLCNKSYKKINKLYTQLILLEKDFDEDLIFASHNIHLLTVLNRKEKRNKSAYRRVDPILIKTIENAIKQFNTYPFAENDLPYFIKIMEMYLAGKSEEEISKKINKSRSYIRAKYKEGEEALSEIIWGYSNKLILNNKRGIK